MNMSRPSSQCSNASSNNSMVLPPIISNEADRLFLIDLNSYIDGELASVGANNPEARFAVYKEALNLLIDHLPSYKPLLSRIKAEYEDCIGTIVSGSKEASYLSGKVQAMALETGTIHNYKRRKEELLDKISVIADDNEKLKEQIRKLKATKENKGLVEQESQADTTTIKKEHRQIPGLTVKEATDPNSLKQELENLEHQIKDLNIAQKTRYLPKGAKEELKEQLDKKVDVKNELEKEVDVLKMKLFKLKVASDAADVWGRTPYPSQTVGEAVVSSVNRATRQTQAQQDTMEGEYSGPVAVPSGNFEDDDPSQEKEAEVMLEYIEKFNELLESKQFRGAALHAANSPKGILRTADTLHRFQALPEEDMPGHAALTFCEALVSTVPAFGMKPNELLSLQCVESALRELRHDMVFHWVSQDRLTISIDIAQKLQLYCSENPQSKTQCMAVIQQIYIQLDEHFFAVKCMLSQGRVKQAVSYAKNKGNLPAEKYEELLEEYPTTVLAQALFREHLLPLNSIIEVLSEDRSAEDVMVKFLVDFFSKHKDDSTPNLLQAIHESPDSGAPSLWMKVSKKLSEQGFMDCALEVRAAAFVLYTLQGANSVLGTKSKTKKKKRTILKKSSVKFSL